MESIDDKILRHIVCDYQYGVIPNVSMLNEEHGIVPEIGVYVSCFSSFVESKIFPFIDEGGTYSQTIRNAGIFYPIKNRFFDGCEIEIIASIREGSASWQSGYDQNESFFNESSGYVVIKISAGASDKKQLMSLLCSNFAHELTHAYDDYRSRAAGYQPLKDVTRKSAYKDRVLTWNLGDTKNKRMLGRVLYLLSPIERNALIGQIAAELDGKSTKSPKDALAAIKETTSYKQYLYLKNSVEAINSTTDNLVKQDILSAYTDWIGYNKNRNKYPDRSVHERKNLSYEGFLSELNYMFRKWERKYLNVVGKIAYSHYLNNEMGEINVGEEGSGELMKNPLKHPDINESLISGGMEYYYGVGWMPQEF